MRPFFVLTVAVTLVFSSCQGRREVSDVWNYIKDRPDSALAVLKGMNATLFHGRTLAEYRLLKAMALDKNYVNVASDSLARPAYEFFRRHGPRDKEMMSLYYLAVSYFYSRDDSEAVVLLEEVSDMAGLQGNLYYSGLSYMLKSNSYSRTYCLSESLKSAELGMAAFAAIPDSFQVQRAKVQLASAYHSRMCFDKAVDIFQELISTCQTDTFTMRRALLHGAYSLYLASPEKADSALRMYNRAVNEYGARMDVVEAAHYGEVLCAVGDTLQARQISEQLKAIGRHPEQRAFLDYVLYKKENKPWKAIDAVEDLHHNLDSIMVFALEQSLTKVQRDYQEQKKQLAEQSVFQTKLIGAVCLLCLLLVFVVVVLSLEKKRKVAALEHELMIGRMGEAVAALHDIEQRNLDLENNLQIAQEKYVSAYKKQFFKISAIIADYYASSGDINGRDFVYRKVMDIAATIGFDQTRMSALERDINAALDNAMKWYREEYPKKEPGHYNMVCLFMAGFTMPLVEVMTHIPKNTLYSKKSRLLGEIREGNAPHKELFLLAIK